MTKVLVSACLLGSEVRWDATSKLIDHPVLRRWIEEGRVVSVCPEMLGGLGTPRPPAEIVNNGSRHVVTNQGNDVTAAFREGARLAADEAAVHGIRIAILKEGSPSCGSSFIYDGTFTKCRIEGEGITAELLRARGIRVFSELELDEADRYLRSV